MMYNVIILHVQDLFVRLHENDQWAFSKKSLWGPFSKPAFFGAQKRRLLLDGEKTLIFQNEGCSVKIAEYWPRSIYH